MSGHHKNHRLELRRNARRQRALARKIVREKQRSPKEVIEHVIRSLHQIGEKYEASLLERIEWGEDCRTIYSARCNIEDVAHRMRWWIGPHSRITWIVGTVADWLRFHGLAEMIPSQTMQKSLEIIRRLRTSPQTYSSRDIAIINYNRRHVHGYPDQGTDR